MSLDGVSGKAFLYEKIKSSERNQKTSGSEDGFLGNLKEMALQEKEESKRGWEAVSDKERSGQIDFSYGMGAAEIMLLRNGRVKMSAVLECSTRHISYSECDDMKIFLSEGYTLKAKAELDEHRVYIEQKNEDGTVKAYEVNPFKIAEDTDDPMEQMALEAWEKAGGLMHGGTFTEAFPETEEEAADFEQMLEEFRIYVEKRLKDGPPKIPTGGSEFSEEEWEKMLQKIDESIDAYKEELRERIRKQEGERPKNPPAKSAVETKSLAETAGAEAESGTPDEASSKTKDVAVSEREAIAGAGAQERAQRGSSLLARLSGEKKAPYSYLADASGQIHYNGVTFYCDHKKQQLCLGDMSDSKNVLNIPLSKGGSLRVNRDNLGDLAKAIGMFSAEDVGRILRAIARDNQAQSMEFEIEMEKMK